ncbi:hypothetical protein [Pedobacter sp. NJ-S-72]
MFNFFIKGEATALKTLTIPPIQNQWISRSVYSLKYVLIVYFTLSMIGPSLNVNKQRGDAAPKSPLYGVYTVDSFVKNNDTIPQESKEKWRWKLLMMEGPDSASIKYMNEETDWVQAKTNTVTKKIAIIFKDDPKNTNYLSYQIPDQDHLILTGKLYGDDSVNIKLTKKQFELTKRGFNWISNIPYNR